MNLAIRSSWSEPQSAPGLVFAYCIELLHLCLKKYNQCDFGIDHLVKSMCSIVSCAVERRCLLWPVCSLGKILLSCALLRFVIQGQTCLLVQIISWLPSFTFQFRIMNRTPFLVLVHEALVGLYRTIQLQFLQHYWSGHRLRLPWYWMVCLGNEQRSFCCFWDCIQVLHFGLLFTMMVTPFLIRDSCPQ